MNDIFNRMILDNTIAQYIFVFVLIALAYVLKKYVGRAASKIIFLVMNLMGRKIDEKAFIDLVLYPVQTFLFWLITISAIYSLQFPKLFYFQFLKTNTHRLLNIFSTAALVITFFWVLMRIIDYLAMVMERRANLTADQSDNQLVVFFKDFLKVIVAIAGLLAVLKFALQIDITKILAGLELLSGCGYDGIFDGRNNNLRVYTLLAAQNVDRLWNRTRGHISFPGSGLEFQFPRPKTHTRCSPSRSDRKVFQPCRRYRHPA